MANGNADDQTMWTAIRTIERDLSNLAREGCGHKTWHEAISTSLRTDLTLERKDREEMGKDIFKKLEKLYWMIIGALGGITMILLKSYLPKIFGG